MKLSTPPTQSELEELRVECAKEAGWTHIAGHKHYDDWAGWYAISRVGERNGVSDEIPLYSTSYDAIMPEIQKLEPRESYELAGWLYKTYDTTALSAQPYQLALAWLHVKQQNKKEV